MRSNFSILTVCTGNVCRSPMAQHLLLQRLRGIPGIEITSAGAQAQIGQPMFGTTQRLARLHGVEDPESHRARQLNQAEIQASDLVLAMTGDHRRKIVELSPRTTRRVFTLREFARLAEATTEEDLETELTSAADTPAERLRAAVQAATLSRNLVPPLKDPSDQDVIDPYRCSDDVHRASTNQIMTAINAVALLLRRSLGGGFS